MAVTYTANHQQRHNGILYEKGEAMKLTPGEALNLLMHKAVTKTVIPPAGPAEKPAKKEAKSE